MDIEDKTRSARNSWSWQQNVQACAERLSAKIEEAFVFEMGKADVFLPYRHEQNTPEQIGQQKLEQFQVFMDYTIGTTIAVLAHYGSKDSDFEEYIVKLVQDKFYRLRAMNKMEEKNVTP